MKRNKPPVSFRMLAVSGLLALPLAVACASLDQQKIAAERQGIDALAEADAHASSASRHRDEAMRSTEPDGIRKESRAARRDAQKAERFANLANEKFSRAEELQTRSNNASSAAQLRLLRMSADFIELESARAAQQSASDVNQLRSNVIGLEERVDRTLVEAERTRLNHIIAGHQVYVRAMHAVLGASYPEKQQDFSVLYEASLRILQRFESKAAQPALGVFAEVARAQFGPWELYLRSPAVGREDVLPFCDVGNIEPPNEELRRMLESAVEDCLGFAADVGALPERD